IVVVAWLQAQLPRYHARSCLMHSRRLDRSDLAYDDRDVEDALSEFEAFVVYGRDIALGVVVVLNPLDVAAERVHIEDDLRLRLNDVLRRVNQIFRWNRARSGDIEPLYYIVLDHLNDDFPLVPCL